MTAEALLEFGRQGLWLALVISAPLALAALIVGLIAGFLQTATGVQEPSLSAVPKLLAVYLVALAFGTFAAVQLARFATTLWLTFEPLAR